VKSYDEKGYAEEIDIFLWDSGDERKAQQVMSVTGIPTELDAVILVFRRYQSDFLKWWSGDKSAAPEPLSKKEIQKLKKKTQPAPLEEIRQEHESFLAELEGLAVEALATNNWDAFYAHIVSFQNEHDLHGKSEIALKE
jgi:hypothetical protein